MIPGIIIIGIGALIVSCALFKKCRWKIFKTGSIEADAIVLSTQLTGIRVKDDVQAIIQLQVLPEKNKNFVSDLKKTVSIKEYRRVQPGKKVRVKYNPGNHKQIHLIEVKFLK